MYNDIDLFKKIVIYDQVKKKELINNNAEEIKNSKDTLNTKINTDIENAVQGFNVHTEGLNDLTNYIYSTNICNIDSNKVRKSDGTKLSESDLDSLNNKEKNTNNICCNNPDVEQILKDNNFSCYPKESFGNYKNIEKFSEDDTEIEEGRSLIDPELEEIKEIINTEDIPMPESTETTLFNSKLLESDFANKVSKDGTPYDGLSIPGDLKISKKNGAIVHIDGKDTRLCGTGKGRMCTHLPYKNNNTYIRPGKKNTNNIYITHAKHFRAEHNKSNDLCGRGSGRMCSHFPWTNNHTYIRPGKSDRNMKNRRNNIFVTHAKHFRAENNRSNDLCGTGSGRMCSHFPWTNNHTYIRPGKKYTNNIYLTHAKHFRAEHNKSNDLCGRGSGRLCSHYPWLNGHTYVRPGNRNKNIYIGGTGKWDETNTTVINSKNPVQIKSGINIDNGKKLCIGNECLEQKHIKMIKDALNN
jgi:hypothetical protein